MARNSSQFKQQIKDLSNNAMKAAMTASFTVGLTEDDSVETIITIVSRETAKAFANEMQKLGPIIDDYIDSLVLDLTKVKSPNGPLTGVGTIMKK